MQARTLGRSMYESLPAAGAATGAAVGPAASLGTLQPEAAAFVVPATTAMGAWIGKTSQHILSDIGWAPRGTPAAPVTPSGRLGQLTSAATEQEAYGAVGEGIVAPVLKKGVAAVVGPRVLREGQQAAAAKLTSTQASDAAELAQAQQTAQTEYATARQTRATQLAGARGDVRTA